MKVTQSTNIGQRQENQDYMLFEEYPEGVLAVVCDGMGGGIGGKEASRIAVTTFSETFKALYKRQNSINFLRDMLVRSITAANIAVFKAANGEMMGTTCVGGFITEKDAFIVNIGDSRAYLVSDDNIHQITKDHSLVQQKYDRGEISYEQLKNHPKKNMLTRVLGIYENITSDYFEVPRVGGKILLCTDGLTNAIDDDKLLKIFGICEEDAISRILTDVSVMAGGKDNITVIVID